MRAIVCQPLAIRPLNGPLAAAYLSTDPETIGPSALAKYLDAGATEDQKAKSGWVDQRHIQHRGRRGARGRSQTGRRHGDSRGTGITFKFAPAHSRLWRVASAPDGAGKPRRKVREAHEDAPAREVQERPAAYCRCELALGSRQAPPVIGCYFGQFRSGLKAENIPSGLSLHTHAWSA